MAAPEFLKKEYGPFTGGVWIVVIVGGVGLGLVLRRFMNNRPGDSEPTTAPNYGVETGAPAFAQTGGSLYNQGQIVSDVIEAIRAQEPPPATTDPEVTPDPAPRPAPPPVNLPAPQPTTPPPTPAPTPAPTRTYTVVRGDTLKKIAARLLGDESRNVEIRKLNPQHTKSWDHLDIGEVLKIPAK